MILASKSPRRKEILEGFGFKLRVETIEIEEVSDKVGIEEQLMDIAMKKSVEVAKINPKEYVVAADTSVILDGKMLGKPRSREEAIATLKSLSGRTHRVLTSYTLLNIEKKIEIKNYDETKVFFKELSTEEIEWYVDTKEPMDKAGSYGIQGKGSILVDKIEGDFFNVMGFPLSKFYDELKRLGLTMEEIKNI